MGLDPDVVSVATRSPANVTAGYGYGALTVLHDITERWSVLASARYIRFRPSRIDLAEPSLPGGQARIQSDSGADPAFSLGLRLRYRF